MDSTSTKIIQFISDFSSVEKDLNSFEDRVGKTANNVNSKFQSMTKTVGDSFGKMSKTEVTQLTGDFSNLANKTVSSSQKIKDAAGNLGLFTEKVKVSSDGVRTVTTSFQSLDKNSVSLGENLARLVKRAALTIPVWFAIRQSISSVNMVIGDGIKALADHDRALQKVKRNLSGSTQEINANMASLSDEIDALSVKTGISTDKIADAIKKFATIGFNFEESMAGGIGATKLSVLLFGEAGDTANAFARALKLLIDRSQGAKSAAQQMNEAYALTAELEKTNQFEIEEVAAGLENFATSAKIANLSMRETLVLLATLGTAAVGGARGGTLLRTSFQKLVENLDEVTKQLGLKFNPEVDNTFTILLQVVDALSKLDQTSATAVETTGALAKIFGGIRGSLPIQAFIALNQQLKENLAIEPNVDGFTKSYEEQTKTLNRLIDRFHALNKLTGRAFVSGLTGEKEFLVGLEKIIVALEDIQKDAQEAGFFLREIFNIPETFKGKPFIFRIFDDATKRQLNKDVEEINAKTDTLFSKINKSFKPGKLSLSEIKDLRIELTTLGAKQLKLDDSSYKKLVEYLNTQIQVVESKEQEIKQSDEEIVAFNKKQDIAKMILEKEIERLQNQGALNSEILKVTSMLSKQLGIEESEMEILERRLDTEKAINEEKRLQSKLGSDSMKLFKIAQEQGVDIAKQIGDVLAGETDFSSFIRKGGKAAETFANQFSDLFEGLQAEQFFKGEKVSTLPQKGVSGFNFDLFSKQTKDLSQLRGGQRIAIQEEAIRGIDTSGARVELLQAINEFKQIEKEKLSKDVTIDRPANVTITGLANLPTNNTPILSNRVISRDQSVVDLQYKKTANSPLSQLDELKRGSLSSPNVIRQHVAPTGKIDINFDANSFSIHGGSKEEQLKQIEESFSKMATPGTPENKKLQKALFGTNQTI